MRKFCNLKLLKRNLNVLNFSINFNFCKFKVLDFKLTINISVIRLVKYTIVQNNSVLVFH